MKNAEILKNFIEKNNGLLLASDVKKLNIHNQYVKLLCNENYIYKVEKGVYAKKEKNVNEFFLIQQRYKSGIFSHNTALYFYHLTDRTPIKYDLTFKNNIRISNDVVKAHYINQDCYEIGLTKMNLEDGTTIKLYDMERTIIDIVRDRNKIDLQIFNNAMNDYVKRNDKNFARLGKYAKIFKVENVLKKYMEVLR